MSSDFSRFEQNNHGVLSDAGETLQRMNDGLQLQLAELAAGAKSRDAVAADTRAQLELIYRQAFISALCAVVLCPITTCAELIVLFRAQEPHRLAAARGRRAEL
jgi:hypothetical protein